MDNFIKITTGWVRQYYEPNKDGVFVCTSQEFETGDLREYEDDGGNPIDPPKYEYQSYEMIQPRQDSKENKTSCVCCGRYDCGVEWRKNTGQYECEDCYQNYLGAIWELGLDRQ